MHALDFIDAPALLRQLAALPVFAGAPHSVRRGIKLKVVRSSRLQHVSGNASLHRRILRLVVPQWATGADIAEVMLHELVHLALPRDAHHGPRFRLWLARAAREAWGIDADPHPPAIQGIGRHGISAYELDRDIQEAILPLVASGAVKLPEPAKQKRERRIADVVERRAAHAAKMLARAERRLKLARTVEKKWRAKVRYYERTAAKRGQS